MRVAIRDRSTFNIITTSLGFKVDVFIPAASGHSISPS